MASVREHRMAVGPSSLVSVLRNAALTSCVLSAIAALAPSPSSAQEAPSVPLGEAPRDPGRTEPDDAERRRLLEEYAERRWLLEEEAAVDWESRHATALYIASAVLFFGGLGAGIGGWALSSPSVGSFAGAAARDDASSARLAGWTLLGVGGAMVFSSLFTFGFAVTFDGSSGARRAELERRRGALPSARLTIGPIDAGGVLVGFAGSF
jgi:hypothetical protein